MNRTSTIIAIAAAAVLAAVTGAQERFGPDKQWFKGNTHAHTLNSDGDSPPDEVVRWYREQGYHFVALTDHNYLTGTDTLNGLHGAAGKFMVLSGEEVTEIFERKPVHLNGLHLKSLVPPQGGSSLAAVLQRNVDAIRAAGGVPHINHPNFGWALSEGDLQKVENNRLIEIYNGHPLVNNAGGGGVPGVEEVWDRLLTAGKRVYGIAVDDAHHFKRPWDPTASKPGKGWVTVRAERLEADLLVAALDRGDFYASTGVELRRIDLDGRTLRIEIDEQPGRKYRTVFTGAGGRELADDSTAAPAYTLTGSEVYVRARITDSNGHLAWVQPVFTRNGSWVTPD